MYVQSIAHGVITLSLGPAESRLIARACHHACDHLTTVKEEHDLLHVEALEAAFQLAATIARAQVHLPLDQHDLLQP